MVDEELIRISVIFTTKLKVVQHALDMLKEQYHILPNPLI